ncbi:hypothetical protein ARMGADRAFT_1078973 [Armillaria gallica]|uniref:Uncharacterized protein n=1 Tax=Armillaria gallica TaxID=47427 RepID=A0A2H3DGC4_ARMGA|nr:hypothetical protein ARMGADRAFT_1078973 [Armillaria gallica]
MTRVLLDVLLDDLKKEFEPASNSATAKVIEPGTEKAILSQSKSDCGEATRRSGEPTFIVVPGATSGSSSEKATYADSFRTAVWTLAIAPDTPLTSLRNLESFFFSKIKAEGPTYPYHLVSYSSTSVFLLVLLKLSEDSGDKIIQPVMLNHFLAISVYAALPTIASVPIS